MTVFKEKYLIMLMDFYVCEEIIDLLYCDATMFKDIILKCLALLLLDFYICEETLDLIHV